MVTPTTLRVLIMIREIQFETCSTTKTYATAENARKAVVEYFGGEEKMKADTASLRFFITQAGNGRWVPVFVGQEALSAGMHFRFHVVM